jgi:adenine-specific DNA-methyltransferase
MDKQQLRNILQQPYKFDNWKKVVDFVFPNVSYFRDPQPIPHSSDKIQSFRQLGNVRLNDGKNLAMFEIKVAENVNIPRNRVALRSLVAPLIDQERSHGVLVIFEQGKEDYRFTFTARETDFDEETADFVQRETDRKRFTYVLGINESCRTASDRFFELSHKKSQATIKDVESAFSVERLSKEFFTKYKAHYAAIVDYLAGSNYKVTAFNGDEKRIRDFVKVLLGRIVFLHFVQKKGWLGASDTNFADGDKNFMLNFWNQGGKDESFYTVWLATLFFGALNKDGRPNQAFAMPDGTMVCVPFLGGGLFEKDRNEPELITFPPQLFDDLFNFFGEYNFTIDENDPYENEVGIDPEMLGHIFENLLEDNKDKGAFYTPKPIVKYMCQESLIQYLLTKLQQNGLFEPGSEAQKDVEEKLGNFVKKYEAGDLIDYDNLLAKALHTIKVCDPAIGSGAFPMGILNEMVMLINVLHHASPDVVEETWKMDNWQPATVKKHIIQNSIYGVDIEKGAVDIARLRFWLSLVLDEEKPSALPNLDYKIVVGNSLVSKLGDTIINIDWTLDETSHGLFGVELSKRKGELLKKISAQQKEFFNPNSDKKKLAAGIRNLKIDLLINQLELMVKTKGIETKPNRTGNKMAEQTELYLQTLDWKSSIDQLIKLKAPSISIGADKPINFFDWKLDFADVLNGLINPNAGFDVIIANPPYVGVKGNQKIFHEIKQSYLSKFLKGRSELFYFFIHQAINLGKDKSVNTFITTNYFITASDANVLRKALKDETTILKLLNFNEMKLFPSAQGQHNMITIFKKGLTQDSIVKSFTTKYKGFPKDHVLSNIFDLIDANTDYFTTKHSEVFEGNNHHIRIEGKSGCSNSLKNIFEAINCEQTLGDICFVRQGLRTGIDKITDSHIVKFNYSGIKGDGVFILSESELKEKGISKNDSLIRPLFKNSDVQKFTTSLKTNKYLIYTDNSITLNKLKTDHSAIFNHLKIYSELIIKIRNQNNEDAESWFMLDRPREEWIFEGDKIVAPQRSRTNTFGYNEVTWYSSADVYYIKTNNKNYKLKYILALLNSRLFFIWLSNKGKRKGEMLELYQQPLSEIPIKEVSNNIQSILSSLAEQIILRKYEGKDTNALEQKIDNQVYRLYDLTYDEVKVIDPEFGLSEEEYNSIKLEG